MKKRNCLIQEIQEKLNCLSNSFPIPSPKLNLVNLLLVNKLWHWGKTPVCLSVSDMVCSWQTVTEVCSFLPQNTASITHGITAFIVGTWLEWLCVCADVKVFLSCRRWAFVLCFFSVTASPRVFRFFFWPGLPTTSLYVNVNACSLLNEPFIIPTLFTVSA